MIGQKVVNKSCRVFYSSKNCFNVFSPWNGPDRRDFIKTASPFFCFYLQKTVYFHFFLILRLVMAYMEMFGNCSHSNETEYMRHSVHMVPAHWAQSPPQPTLPTTQSCSFSQVRHKFVLSYLSNTYVKLSVKPVVYRLTLKNVVGTKFIPTCIWRNFVNNNNILIKQ